MHLKTGLIFLVICLALQVQGSKEIPNKINRNEAKQLADKTERTTKRSRVSTIRKIFDMAKHRTKRSSIFPTGVKVCPQESVKQILASHQAYYRLRVCQEAVWEAFRIFLDRIPDTNEYQNWVNACQRETFCIFDIGKNFSNSQEHLEIIQRRVKHRPFQERKDEISTEKTGGKKLEDISSLSTAGAPNVSPPPYASAPNGTLRNEIVNDTKTPVKGLEPEVTNTVPELPVEQMVEFSVTLINQEYTTELNDPNSPHYQELAGKFQHQMQKIFEKLPGFKEIHVLGFSRNMEKDGSSSTVARYVVNFERDSSEVKGTGDDISTIGSNKVENEKSPLSTKEEEEIPGIKFTVTDLQQLVAMALQEDQSLIMDLGTLQFTNEAIKPSSDSDNDIKSVVTIAPAGTESDDGLSAELPLGYPSPATVEQTGDDLISEYTTGSTMLSGDISAPENFISSKPAFPAKPSSEWAKEQESESLKETEDMNIIIDHQSSTVPFSTLDSTDGPLKSEDSDLPPPADESASNDLSTRESEVPAEQVVTRAAYTTPPNFLQPSDQKSEAERKKEQTVSTDLGVSQENLSGQAVKIIDPPESSGDILSTDRTLPFFIDSSDHSTSLPEEVIIATLPTDQITLLPAVTSPPHSHSIIIDQPFEVTGSPAAESSIPTGFETGVQDIAAELDRVNTMSTVTMDEVEYGSGYISGSESQPAEATPAPTLKYVTTSSMTTAAKGKELVVFFSLRVTNMHFSDDLFNRSSLEYRALEQQFMQLLLPYLQSNLTGFKQLEILNFRNGSVIVNSKMKFAKTVPYNITEAVHCVLEDFCDAAAQRLNLEIDSYSLDIEPADQADPCKFMACDEFSECITNEWTKEADCLCKPGYASRDGLPCRSLCEMQPHLCVNGGKCELVPGKGAVCRCPVRRHRFYQGERCAKFAPEPIQPFILKAVVLSLLSLVFLVIILIVKIRRKCKNQTNLEGPAPNNCGTENAVRINPIFEHDEPISSFSHMPCSVSACVSSSEIINQRTLHKYEKTTQCEGHQMILQNQD
ncbi:interphotoreceptor matrix proteoglycan 1 [Terrapene carolina triunguis]|uniref:interphotoreceptor matrix proteoglycan 1 n=1 Tax=Terrapene triunguis TaxID=2587831 RepID=UPI000E778D86|nr:interphotoreceptor matrix proteoglycan 1 [Terrapene carolina triunguis]